MDIMTLVNGMPNMSKQQIEIYDYSKNLLL